MGRPPSNRVCSIEGCERKHAGRGWCQLHLRRWRENGDPLVARAYGRSCQVAGCTARHHAGGFCSAHGHRAQRHGDPLAGSAERLHGDLATRLMARVEIRECGCWSWQASTDRRGYAWIGDGAGKVRRAHVLLYEEFVEPVSEGLELDHLCRNTSCVNPDHLEPVTHIENVRRSLTQERCSCLAAS